MAMRTDKDAREIYAELGATRDVIQAMVRAERYGNATAHGATIVHAGYQPATTEHSAATSLYRVRY